MKSTSASFKILCVTIGVSFIVGLSLLLPLMVTHAQSDGGYGASGSSDGGYSSGGSSDGGYGSSGVSDNGILAVVVVTRAVTLIRRVVFHRIKVHIRLLTTTILLTHTHVLQELRAPIPIVTTHHRTTSAL